MKNLWIFTRDFPPHNSIAARRFNGLAPHFETFNWKPWVVTFEAPVEFGKAPGHLKSRLPIEQVVRLLEDAPVQSRVVHGFAKIVRRLGAGFTLWTPRFFLDDWSRVSADRLLRECSGFPRPEALLCTVPQGGSIRLCRELGRRMGVPWFVDFRDLRGLRDDRPGFLVWLDRLVEGWLLREAAGLVGVSPTITQMLSEAYAKPALTIYNGRNRVQSEVKAQPYLYYAGSFYPWQLPAVEMLCQMLEEFNLVLKIRSLGPPEMTERLKVAAGRNSRVELLEPAPPDVVHSETCRSYANLVFEDLKSRALFSRGTLTGKLMQLVSYPPPVITIARADSDITTVLAETGAGWLCSGEEELRSRLSQLPIKLTSKRLEPISRSEQARKLCRFLDQET